MKSNPLRSIIYVLGRFLYEVIGPHYSTQLAHSSIGRSVFQLLNGGSNRKRLYTTKFNFKLLLFPREAQSFGIAYLGVINPFETQLLQNILQPHDVVFDIGTYVDGWYSLLASQLVGRKGKVYAFEPIPIFFRRLKENVRLNNLSNIVLNNIALSKTSGKRYMYLADGESSFFKEYAQQRKGKSCERVLVVMDSLDSYVRRHSVHRIDFIKIDVEGAEMDVLKGAFYTIKRYKPDILLELIENNVRAGGYKPADVITFMNALGYKPYCITPTGLLPFQFGKQRTHNVFFSQD